MLRKKDCIHFPATKNPLIKDWLSMGGELTNKQLVKENSIVFYRISIQFSIMNAQYKERLFRSSVRRTDTKVSVLWGATSKNVVVLGNTHHNFWAKKYHFFFLLQLDPEAFKTCKNTTKLLNLRVLPYLGLFQDRLSS